MPERDRDLDLKTAVHTPSQSASYAVSAVRAAAKALAEDTGIGLPIAEIRDYVPPVMPGQIAAIIGQTSNYKSGFMHFIEHEAATRLSKKGHKNHILIHVSVEETIEDQAYVALSREMNVDAGEIARGAIQDWSLLEQAAIRIGDIPIYRIGESLARADDMPMLYLSNMMRAIDFLVNGDVLDWKVIVAGIFFDYLQAFPIDPEIRQANRDQQRRLQVRSDVYRLRQAARKYACPVFVNVQAKQHLDGARAPVMLPGVYDGEETSSIAQRFDRIFSIWMPKTTFPVGESFEYRSRQFIVRENSLWIKVAKQRGRLPAGRVWPCVIDFNSNVIAPEAQGIDRGTEYPNGRFGYE